MTVPAGAGQPFTLVPGAAPVMLTEYAGGRRPTQVINLDPAGPRVYLSSSSQISPASGVPLDPGTATPWSPPGQLWAVADPAGTKNATVVLTAAVDHWSPSPAAIAAQVAAQLLANGVPSVLTSQFIGSFVIPNGGQTPLIDVHAFATLLGVGAFTKSLGMGWQDNNGTGFIGDPNVIFSQGVEIPVALPFVYFTNNTGAQVTINLSGTNRAASHMFPAYYNRYSGEGLSMSTGLISPMVIGTKYDLFANFGVLFTGLGYLFFRMSNVAATGEWEAVTFDGDILPLADSAECVNLSVGEKGVYKLCALPPNIQKFTFTAQAGVNNNAKISGCSAAAII